MSSFFGIAPLFRGPFLERVAAGKHRGMMLELGEHFSSFSPPSLNEPLRNWFDFFYSILRTQYRCEYVYKNAIAIHQYLVEPNPHQTSLLLDEFDVGKSRADVAILNGTSIVYEVKSKYDSLDRLEIQVSDYLKAFDRVYVVTTDERVAEVRGKIKPPVGVMRLTSDDHLDVIEEAQPNKGQTDPGTVFDCMRQKEFCSAVQDAHGHVPDVPNSMLYTESRKLFCQLDSDRAHDLMVDKIRGRVRKKPFVDLINDAPTSLKHACIAFSKTQKLAIRIKERLNEPLLG